MTPRNFSPLEIPCKPITEYRVIVPEYPLEIRSQVTAIAMQTVNHDPKYTNHWMYSMDWKVEGERLHKRISNSIFKSSGAAYVRRLATSDCRHCGGQP